MATIPTNTELLGYEAGARLLIVNADDFGMCHSINAATVEAMRTGIVTTTSLMACCPWAWEALQMLKEDASLSFGVHLTLVNEMPWYRWGPVAPNRTVPSLVNRDGFFFAYDEIGQLYTQAALDEVECEFRAQIERVLGFGVQPTHLDWHCVLDGGRPDILELTLRLCDEFGLAMRVSDATLRDQLLARGKPATDYPVVDSYRLPVAGKFDRWARMLRELPPGLNQWAVHVSTGDAEARAMEPDQWQVRRSDFDFFTSDVARNLVATEGIVLTDYREIQARWAAAVPGADSIEATP